MGNEHPPTVGADWLLRYRGAPDDLAAAVAGLTDRALDLRPAAGEWSIREIVNHVAEVEVRAAFFMHVALGNPGAALSIDWFPETNLRWGSALGFGRRAIGPALDVIRATRMYMGTVLESLGGCEERYVLVSGGEIGAEPTQLSVARCVRGYTEHIDEHVAEIRRIRSLHGV